MAKNKNSKCDKTQNLKCDKTQTNYIIKLKKN